MYTINPIKFLFAVDDHIFRIRKAEEIRNTWKIIIVLILSSLLLYSVMGILGIGSSAISSGVASVTPSEYEMQKLWFIIGRLVYSVAFALFVLFVPSLIYYFVTKIPYKKLLLMQIIVLFVLLMERLLWIPLVVYFGLDWFLSPLSFGILASYFTDITFIIYFFGAISIFQLWIIVFQVRFLSSFTILHKAWIWSTVILFHVAIWTLTAAIAFSDTLLINRWFNL